MGRKKKLKHLIEKEDEDLWRIGCESKLQASLEYAPIEGKNFKYGILTESEIHDFIWGVVNQNKFMERYLYYYTVPYLKRKLRSALETDVDIVSTEIPIGKIFFTQTMILNAKGEPEDPEEHVLIALLNTARQQLKEWSRRLAKSWFMKNDMLYHSIFDAPCYSLYTCQSWDVSKEHLRLVEVWLDRNPLLYKSSGGLPSGYLKRKWSDSNKYLMNGSQMSCRTVTMARKMSGKSPNRLYQDEKALYPLSSHSEELGIMTRGQPDSEKFSNIIASAHAGIGTLFFKMCRDPNIRQFWDHSFIPVCERISFNRRGVPYFHNIATNRLSQRDLLEEWYELGPDRFMEQFMLQPMSVEDRAIPEEVIDQFFNRNLGEKFESPLPCVISYDLGKSIAHRSVIEIGEVQPTGQVYIIRIIRFPPKHPFRTRKGGKKKGVIDMIPDLCDNYNFTHLIGDATGMGADEPYDDLKEMVVPKGIPSSNIVPYKWESRSEKFMGKAPLWYNLVLPKIQQDMIKSIFNDHFEWEMRVWRAAQSSSGLHTTLKPEKQTYSDDLITTMMQIAYVAFKWRGLRASPTKSAPGLYGSSPRTKKYSRSGSISRPRVREPRWRKGN